MKTTTGPLRAAAALVAALAIATAARAAGGAATAPAAPASSSAAPAAAQPPIHVTAEAAEYLNREGVATFTGKVVAVQGDTTITADRMEVRFTEPEGGRRAAGPDPGKTRVASIVATGTVTIRQLEAETGKERYAVGERGVYEAEARTMTLTGAPRLWEGKNVVTGEEVVFHLETKVFAVRGKVNMTIFPEGAPEVAK